jgi:hypothetical protein
MILNHAEGRFLFFKKEDLTMYKISGVDEFCKDIAAKRVKPVSQGDPDDALVDRLLSLSKKPLPERVQEQGVAGDDAEAQGCEDCLLTEEEDKDEAVADTLFAMAGGTL